MSIRDLGEDRKRNRWKVTYGDPDRVLPSGRMAQRSKLFDRFSDAQNFEDDIRRKKARGESIARVKSSEISTFGQLADEWLKREKAKGRDKKTVAGNKSMVTKWLKPELGDRRVDAVESWDFLDLPDRLKERKCPDRTIARSVKLARTIMALAVRERIIRQNPGDVIVGQRDLLPKQSRKRDIVMLSPDRIEQLRRGMLSRGKYVADDVRLRDAALVSLMGYAGLRPAEAFGLHWDRSRWRKGKQLYVEWQNVGGKLKLPKRGRRRWVRPLWKPLLDDLEAYWVAVGWPKDGTLVFPSDDGELWSTTAMANWRDRIYKPLAPAGSIPYDLRHSHATLLRRAHWPEQNVAKRLGHTTATLRSVYEHYFDEFDGAKQVEPVRLIAAARKKHDPEKKAAAKKARAQARSAA